MRSPLEGADRDASDDRVADSASWKVRRFGPQLARSGCLTLAARRVSTHLTGQERHSDAPEAVEAMRRPVQALSRPVEARPFLAILRANRRIGGIEDRVSRRCGSVVGRRRCGCSPGGNVTDERTARQGLVGFGFFHSVDFQLGKDDLAGMRSAAGRSRAGRYGVDNIHKGRSGCPFVASPPGQGLGAGVPRPERQTVQRQDRFVFAAAPCLFPVLLSVSGPCAAGRRDPHGDPDSIREWPVCMRY